MSAAQQNFSALLENSRVIVCCGSGGVGKTTSAAALSLEAARIGRRVVLITIDPAKRLADSLGLHGLTNDPTLVDIAGKAKGQLWAMMLDARATFDGVIRSQSRDSAQMQRILENPFYKNIASRLSGSQEYMAAEKLFELFNDQRFDLVIVDTPPSREALDFLDAPQKLMNFLDHRVYRWMIAPARGGLKILQVATQPILRTIGRVIGADVLADAINFFQAFDGIEDGFRQRAQAVQKLLKSSDSKYVIVASARQDTIAEAKYFCDQLGSAGIAVSGLILNRLQPTFGIGSAATAKAAARKAEKAGNLDLAALHHNMATLRTVAEAEQSLVLPLINHVGDAVIVRLLQRSQDVHDLPSIAELGRDLVA